jgi:hypothetical protein
VASATAERTEAMAKSTHDDARYFALTTYAEMGAP